MFFLAWLVRLSFTVSGVDMTLRRLFIDVSLVDSSLRPIQHDSGGGQLIPGQSFIGICQARFQNLSNLLQSRSGKPLKILKFLVGKGVQF